MLKKKSESSNIGKIEITADTYHRRFRSIYLFQGETSHEMYVCLKDLFSKWVKPETSTVKEISEAMIF